MRRHGLHRGQSGRRGHPSRLALKGRRCCCRRVRRLDPAPAQPRIEPEITESTWEGRSDDQEGQQCVKMHVVDIEGQDRDLLLVPTCLDMWLYVMLFELLLSFVRRGRA